MAVEHHGHEHEFEPQHGLPERLPLDERILWQGSPDFALLAKSAFHVRKVALYFALLLGWSIATSLDDGATLAVTFKNLWIPLSVYAVALGSLLLLAWLSARTTVYTLTNKRVVMRLGIVLTLTFNLPLKQIASAAWLARGGKAGDVALKIAGSDRIGWAHLWPHARPWHFSNPEPMLRALPDAESVSAMLADAWATVNQVSLAPTAATTAQPVPTPVAADATPTNPRRPAGLQPSAV
jgi:hypothetical protein